MLANANPKRVAILTKDMKTSSKPELWTESSIFNALGIESIHDHPVYLMHNQQAFSTIRKQCYLYEKGKNLNKKF